MEKIASLGFVAFKKTRRVREILDTIVRWSLGASATSHYHPILSDMLAPPATVSHSVAQFLEQSQVLVSIGGDGTFLSVASLAGYSGKPLIGINAGGLGFFADMSAEGLESNLTRIVNGEYRTVQRMVLEAVVRQQKDTLHVVHALNDIYITRASSPRLASISAWYKEQFITEFRADGLIVATPSGSTAYSLAAGGPIVEPGLNALLLTPVCPHSLTERPLVLGSDHPVRLQVMPGSPEMVLSNDGIGTILLHGGDEVTVTPGGEKTNLLQLTDRSWFDLLRGKLDWGRNYKGHHDTE